MIDELLCTMNKVQNVFFRMLTGYFLLLCSLGPVAISHITHPEEHPTTTEPRMMSDETFFAILFGTSFCMVLAFFLGLIIVCLKIRHDLYVSIPFNIQRAMTVTHTCLERSPAMRRLRPQQTFGRV